MDETIKEQWIAQFRHYLEQASITTSVTTSAPDLFSLFTELAGLRNEVKLESRQVKQALEQFRSAFELLQTSQTELLKEHQQQLELKEKHHRIEIRHLLLELIELYDRLEAGTQASLYLQPSKWFCRSQTQMIHSIHEGQAMSTRRLLDILAHYQVHPLTVLNEKFDPNMMKAVAVDTLLHIKNGVVIEELRTGFSWHHEILRLAEVKVNKYPILEEKATS